MFLIRLPFYYLMPVLFQSSKFEFVFCYASAVIEKYLLLHYFYDLNVAIVNFFRSSYSLCQFSASPDTFWIKLNDFGIKLDQGIGPFWIKFVCKYRGFSAYAVF